jgi:hypothetical protein
MADLSWEVEICADIGRELLDVFESASIIAAGYWIPPPAIYPRGSGGGGLGSDP